MGTALPGTRAPRCAPGRPGLLTGLKEEPCAFSPELAFGDGASQAARGTGWISQDAFSETSERPGC